MKVFCRVPFAAVCFVSSFFINDLSKDIKAKLRLYADDEVILTQTSSINHRATYTAEK